MSDSLSDGKNNLGDPIKLLNGDDFFLFLSFFYCSATSGMISDSSFLVSALVWYGTSSDEWYESDGVYVKRKEEPRKIILSSIL